MNFNIEEENNTKFTQFQEELTALINYNSMENGSCTPDFLLAEYLTHSLKLFNNIVYRREKWYGRHQDYNNNLIEKCPSIPPIINHEDEEEEKLKFIQKRMSMVFDEWKKRSIENQKDFDITDCSEYGEKCAVYFTNLTNEMDEKGLLPKL
jgi:hypothetical protein